MAGSGWQALATSAKELAGGARAVTATLGKAVVRLLLPCAGLDGMLVYSQSNN